MYHSRDQQYPSHGKGNPPPSSYYNNNNSHPGQSLQGYSNQLSSHDMNASNLHSHSSNHSTSTYGSNQHQHIPPYHTSESNRAENSYYPDVDESFRKGIPPSATQVGGSYSRDVPAHRVSPISRSTVITSGTTDSWLPSNKVHATTTTITSRVSRTPKKSEHNILQKIVEHVVIPPPPDISITPGSDLSASTILTEDHELKHSCPDSRNNVDIPSESHGLRTYELQTSTDRASFSEPEDSDANDVIYPEKMVLSTSNRFSSMKITTESLSQEECNRGFKKFLQANRKSLITCWQKQLGSSATKIKMQMTENKVQCESKYPEKSADQTSLAIEDCYRDEYASLRCILFLNGKNCNLSCGKLHKLPREDGIKCILQKYNQCHLGSNCIFLHAENNDIGDVPVAYPHVNNSFNELSTVVVEKASDVDILSLNSSSNYQYSSNASFATREGQFDSNSATSRSLPISTDLPVSHEVTGNAENNELFLSSISLPAAAIKIEISGNNNKEYVATPGMTNVYNILEREQSDQTKMKQQHFNRNESVLSVQYPMQIEDMSGCTNSSGGCRGSTTTITTTTPLSTEDATANQRCLKRKILDTPQTNLNFKKEKSDITNTGDQQLSVPPPTDTSNFDLSVSACILNDKQVRNNYDIDRSYYTKDAKFTQDTTPNVFFEAGASVDRKIEIKHEPNDESLFYEEETEGMSTVTGIALIKYDNSYTIGEASSGAALETLNIKESVRPFNDTYKVAPTEKLEHITSIIFDIIKQTDDSADTSKVSTRNLYSALCKYLQYKGIETLSEVKNSKPIVWEVHIRLFFTFTLGDDAHDYFKNIESHLVEEDLDKFMERMMNR